MTYAEELSSLALYKALADALENCKPSSIAAAKYAAARFLAIAHIADKEVPEPRADDLVSGCTSHILSSLDHWEMPDGEA